jgi:hypothetical protein
VLLQTLQTQFGIYQRLQSCSLGLNLQYHKSCKKFYSTCYGGISEGQVGIGRYLDVRGDNYSLSRAQISRVCEIVLNCIREPHLLAKARQELGRVYAEKSQKGRNFYSNATCFIDCTRHRGSIASVCLKGQA